MVNGDVPFVVCVSSDVAVRERVVRRLDDCGAVVLCTDLSELRAMLFPALPLGPPRRRPAPRCASANWSWTPPDTWSPGATSRWR
ncbi:hypothetical protein Prum_046600 [Phytohabitans rumicis]|uniref:Uncharacterized protein n=1 Tax=Phytohabitans rumicis TaxID=1076125 RepID=A0A6V8L7Q9_9ACTN|nr:hypothetical protein Prum_046600 [Phytohabitans rumicis]